MKLSKSTLLILAAFLGFNGPAHASDAPSVIDSVKTFTGRIRSLGPHVQRNSSDFNEGYGARAFDLIAEARRRLLAGGKVDEPLLAATVALAAEVARFDGSVEPADSIAPIRSKFPAEFDRAMKALPGEAGRSLRLSFSALETSLQGEGGG